MRGVIEIDEFCRFPVAVSSTVSEMTSALIAHYDNTPLWIPAGTNKDDLESPIPHGLSADSVDTSLASLLYSYKTDAVLSEVHDQ